MKITLVKIELINGIAGKDQMPMMDWVEGAPKIPIFFAHSERSQAQAKNLEPLSNHGKRD